MAWSRNIAGKAGVASVEFEGDGNRTGNHSFLRASSALVRILNFILRYKSKGKPSEGFKQWNEMIYFTFLKVHLDHCRKDCRGARG